MKALLFVILSLSLVTQANTVQELKTFEDSKRLKVLVSKMEAIEDYYVGDRAFVQAAGSTVATAVAAGLASGIVTDVMVSRFALAHGAHPGMISETINQNIRRSFAIGAAIGAAIGLGGHYIYKTYYTPIAYREQLEELKKITADEAMMKYVSYYMEAIQLGYKK